MERAWVRSKRGLAIAAIVAACAWAAVTAQEAPGAPAGTGFSASAALATLRGLLAEGRPHPVGSAQNAVVRARIVAALAAAGYAPEVTTQLQCRARVGCAEVANITAARAGTQPGRAVLVTAHYDSVPAGPGAGDDGVGVAVVLELARALGQRPAPRNDVVLVLSDGEEQGLFGAEAFAAHDPRMARVAVVVNVEARGASGRSMMFETGPGNARLVALYARAVAHPAANSLAYEIYKRLPNDTDFSVYRRRGLGGFNLAFVGSAALYHSQRDDVDHLDARSVQHHGDNAFALVGALVDADLAALAADADASYFDVGTRWLVVWPSALNLPLAALALLAIVGLAVRDRARLSRRMVAWAVAGVVGLVVALIAAGWLLAYPLAIWPRAQQIDHAAPAAARIALIAALIAVTAAVAGATRRAGWRAALHVGWAVVALLAVAIAAVAPGAAYAALWPCVAFALIGWVRLRAAAWIGFALLAWFWIGHAIALEAAIGFAASAVKMGVLAPAGLGLWPLLVDEPGEARASHSVLAASAVVGVIAAAAAGRAVVSTADHPRAVNVVHHDEGGSPRWLIQTRAPDDEAYLAGTGFPDRDEAYSWLGVFAERGRWKPARASAQPAPRFTVTSDELSAGQRHLSGVLHIDATAYQAGIAVGARSGVRGLRIEGQVVWIAADLADGARQALLSGLGGRDVHIELDLAPDAAGPVRWFSRAPLPAGPEALALEAARPIDAAPGQNGDAEIAVVPLDLARR
jgi:hypothetical protein